MVAEGTYRPDEDQSNPNGTGDRQLRFQLQDSVNILGGFAGFGTADPDVRNITLYETILSGDLMGDDIANLADGIKCFTGEECVVPIGFGCVLLAGCESFDTNNDDLVLASELGIDDNSNFVLSGSGNNETAVLDGFIIKAGNGGGMLISNGEPTVRNCKFETNLNPDLGGSGGGVILSSSSGTPSFTNCVFRNNVALLAGGGIWIGNSDPVLTNCTFVANQVHDPEDFFDVEGAGIAVGTGGAPFVRNSIFWGNIGSTPNTEASQILDPSGTMDIDFSDWQWHAPEGNNINIDPLFLSMPNNLRLQKDSQVRNLGDDLAFPTSLTTDLDGGPRFDGVIDMGAYEWSDCNGNNLDDGHDIFVGTSPDGDGNGIPDECVFPPLPAPMGCDRDLDCGPSSPVACQQDSDCDPDDPNGPPGFCEAGTCRCLDGLDDQCPSDAVCNAALHCRVIEPLGAKCNGGVCECPLGTDEECVGITTCIENLCYVPRNRYLSIQPNNAGSSVALRVKIIDSTNMSNFVDTVSWVGPYDPINQSAALTGNPLSDPAGGPLYDTAWPNVLHIGDRLIAPDSTYEISAWVENSGVSSPMVLFPTTPKPGGVDWGDCVGSFDGTRWSPPNGYTNFDDVLAVIRMWWFLHPEQNQIPVIPPELSWVDIHCECPDQDVKFVTDVLTIVGAFTGSVYPWQNVAGCPQTGCTEETNPPPGSAPTINLLADQQVIQAGGLTSLDAYIDVGTDVVTDVAAYEFALEVVGGSSGTLDLETSAIDTDRQDYIYFGTSIWEGLNGTRVAACRSDASGVTVTSQKYLGTVSFRASPDAAGSFTIKLMDAGDALLTASDLTGIPLSLGDDVLISVGLEAPTAAPAPDDTVKNRYLSFVPNNAEPVAFELELTDSTYFPGSVGRTWWVDEPELVDGSYLSFLTNTPVVRTWNESVVHIGDCRVVPAATYALRATFDGEVLTGPLVESTIPEPTPLRWGDVVGDSIEGVWGPPQGITNINDVFAAIQGFQDVPSAPPLTWVDVEPEDPNHMVNFADVQKIILAFQGDPYPFSAPANCPGQRSGPPVIGDPATFTLFAGSPFIEAGEGVDIEVFIDTLPDLGGYQVTLEVSGGTSGALVLADVTVDPAHADYVFAGLSTLPSPDVPRARVGNALTGAQSGVPVSGPGYLATFSYVPSESAYGDFHVSVVVGQDDTLLMDSNGTRLAYNGGSCTVIGVGFDCHVDADCDDSNDCTIDTCANDACTFSNAASGTACDDGLFCTSTSECDGAGTCVGSGSPCPSRFPVCCELIDTCIAVGEPCWAPT